VFWISSYGIFRLGRSVMGLCSFILPTRLVNIYVDVTTLTWQQKGDLRDKPHLMQFATTEPHCSLRIVWESSTEVGSCNYLWTGFKRCILVACGKVALQHCMKSSRGLHHASSRTESES
jgi:hypothetical protein